MAISIQRLVWYPTPLIPRLFSSGVVLVMHGYTSEMINLAYIPGNIGS